MIQTLLYRLFRQAGIALTAFALRKALKAAWKRLAPKAAPLAAGTLAALAAQIASAHEGHGALGELHAHGDSLWTLALLAAAVLVGLALGKRK
jgi:hypothetical protein